MVTIARLRKPLTRRLNDRRLVIRVSPAGVAFRGVRRRRWQLVTWEQIAAAAAAPPILRASDTAHGREILRAIGAEEQPTQEPAPAA